MNGWFLPREAVNGIQAESIERLIRRAKHAHWTNVDLRINGGNETYQADWIKYIAAFSPSPSKPMEVTEERLLKRVTKALEDLSFECFGGIGTCAPSVETYNRTFGVLEEARSVLSASQGKQDTEGGEGGDGVRKGICTLEQNGQPRCAKQCSLCTDGVGGKSE